mmetsp:Transcript_6667/g.11665  ORF Transcript_6667/g.11665 Transcript_6667/m.11665 type:complete len:328 (+) Transcript_6667:50-1033(+)
MAFKFRRWTLANILPVLVACGIIVTLWATHFSLHLYPALYPECNALLCDAGLQKIAVLEAVVSQSFAAIIVICLIRAIVTDPGSVPKEVPWLSSVDKPQDGEAESTSSAQAQPATPLRQLEVKHTGARRSCKWCVHYKPDRCHHCRVCRSCILRMDHHCPWIANCVGFRNHKFFFLLVFYAALDSTLIALAMWTTLLETLEVEATTVRRFMIVFSLTLAVIMTILLCGFFSFHLWLVLKGTTTIEFCEKTVKTNATGQDAGRWMYDLGWMENLKQALGPCMLCWFLPIYPPSGDGLYFDTAFHLKLADGQETASSMEDKRCPEETGS